MNILVLGASSAVGAALAQEFADDGNLILTGRDRARLETAASGCRKPDDRTVEIMPIDLVEGGHALGDRLEGRNIDLIIDAASASSARRDDEQSTAFLASSIDVDIMAKHALWELLRQRQEVVPGVIFISSVLVRLRSPGRTVYSSLKQLYEAYLKRLAVENPGLRSLVVHVGTVLDNRVVTDKTKGLAVAVREAYLAGNEYLSYGGSGRIMLVLNTIHPSLFSLAIRIQRALRVRG